MASVANIYSSIPVTNTTAAFQAWGNAVSVAINACGWIKTSDANQINWGTVTTPITVITAAGYEVWHMNDTLQSTAPVFMKLEYGTGTANANPQIWFQFGSGANSSGGLIGVLSTRSSITVTGSTNSISTPSSGDVNRFHIALWGFSINATSNTVGTAASCMYFSVERTKDASGNDTNEGLLWTAKNGTAGPTYTQQYLNLATGPTPIETGWGALMPTSVIPASTGVQLGVYPVYHSKGVFVNPGMGQMCVFGTQVNETATLQVPVYGNNHTYICFSNTMMNTPATRGGTSSTFMMRFE